MSPATFIPENSSLHQLVKEWRDLPPWLLEHTTDEEIIADIATIIKTNSMNEIAKNSTPQIFISYKLRMTTLFRRK
jgi:hypothetical protein